MILLPLPPKGWHYRLAPSCLLYVVLGLETSKCSVRATPALYHRSDTPSPSSCYRGYLLQRHDGVCVFPEHKFSSDDLSPNVHHL